MKEIASTDAGNRAIRFRRDLAERLVEEALPLGIFASRHFYSEKHLTGPVAEIELSLGRFEKLVKEAVDGLPEEFQKKMENVNIVVEAKPSDEILKQQGIRQPNTLLGLYHGIPLNENNKNEG